MDRSIEMRGIMTMTAEQAHETLAEVAEEIRQAQIARLDGKRVSVAGITDRVESEAS